VAKLSISKAWDETREVLRRDGKLLGAVALALLVLPGAISDLVTPPAPPGQLPEPGAWIIVAVVALLIGLVGQLAIVRLAIGSRLTVGQAIAHGARRAPVYIAATLIWIIPFALLFGLLIAGAGATSPGAAVAVIVILLTVLLIFLFVRLLLASPVATAEPVGPIGILRRSWELTQGSWWRLFGFVLLFLIAVLFLVLAIGSLVGVIVSLVFGSPEPQSVGALVIALAIQIVAASVSVVFFVMLARIYLQLSGRAADVEEVFR
jgi:hypothetical protein